MKWFWLLATAVLGVFAMYAARRGNLWPFARVSIVRTMTVVFCPGCKKALVSDEHVRYWVDDKTLVHYVCSRCQTESCWDYGSERLPKMQWWNMPKQPPQEK